MSNNQELLSHLSAAYSPLLNSAEIAKDAIERGAKYKASELAKMKASVKDAHSGCEVCASWDAKNEVSG